MTLSDDRIRKWGMLRSALRNGDVDLLQNYIKNAGWQAVNVSDNGLTPLCVAVSAPVNALPMVKLLCKNGADSRLGSYPLILLMGAEHRDVREFFRARHDYVCNMHFYELMDLEEVKEALRHTLLLGYRMNAFASSPVDLALSSSDDERARLIADASKPWSPSTHELWPLKQRMLALELILVGVRLRNQKSCWQPLADPWVHQIVPRVIGNRVATDFWAICLTSIKFILLLKRL